MLTRLKYRTLLSPRTAVTSLCRGFAEAAEGSEVKFVYGVNIKKGGGDPELQPLSEYPDWLPGLATPQPSLYELRQKLAAEGVQNLSSAEVLRMTKLWRRQKVKDQNALKSKKKA